MIAWRAPAPTRVALAGLAVAVFLLVGLAGVYRYADNFWQYRGFAPPKDAAWVRAKGTAERLYVASPALAGRRQPVDVYLPPGYFTHPARRYPVLYLLHGVPGRPAAFLSTVRMGVVEDELVGRGKAQPLILVMPFGSTGSFTDEEWANGVRPGNGWETFVARDLVRRSTAATGRFAPPADARWRGFPRAGTARSTSVSTIRVSSASSRAGRAMPRLRTSVRSSVTGRALLTANTPLDTLGHAAAALTRAHVFVWFYSGTDDKFRFQNEAFARALARARVPHLFFLVRGGHNWALWRGNAADAYLAASRRLGRA